jgi:hypothetical protein
MPTPFPGGNQPQPHPGHWPATWSDKPQRAPGQTPAPESDESVEEVDLEACERLLGLSAGSSIRHGMDWYLGRVRRSADPDVSFEVPDVEERLKRCAEAVGYRSPRGYRFGRGRSSSDRVFYVGRYKRDADSDELELEFDRLARGAEADPYRSPRGYRFGRGRSSGDRQFGVGRYKRDVEPEEAH